MCSGSHRKQHAPDGVNGLTGQAERKGSPPALLTLLDLVASVAAVNSWALEGGNPMDGQTVPRWSGAMYRHLVSSAAIMLPANLSITVELSKIVNLSVPTKIQWNQRWVSFKFVILEVKFLCYVSTCVHSLLEIWAKRQDYDVGSSLDPYLRFGPAA